MTTMNEAVSRRMGEMLLSLCEAETIIAAKDEQIAQMAKELEELRKETSPVEPAQEMLSNR